VISWISLTFTSLVPIAVNAPQCGSRGMGDYRLEIGVTIKLANRFTESIFGPGATTRYFRSL
jgi:hypothetical protein